MVGLFRFCPKISGFKLKTDNVEGIGTIYQPLLIRNRGFKSTSMQFSD
jgi:hypothetical protein